MENTTVEFKIPEIKIDEEGIDNLLRSVTARAVAELDIPKDATKEQIKEKIINAKTSDKDRSTWSLQEKYEHLVDLAVNGGIDSSDNRISSWIDIENKDQLDKVYAQVTKFQEQNETWETKRERTKEEIQQEREEKAQEEAQRIKQEVYNLIASLPPLNPENILELANENSSALIKIKQGLKAASTLLGTNNWEALSVEVGMSNEALDLLRSI